MDKTDAKLKTLEKQIKSVYSKAYQEMKKEASDILAKIEMNPDMSLAQKLALMNQYNRLDNLTKQLANSISNANSVAQKMINNEMVNVYELNYNGDAERLGFSLVDHGAVKKILKEEENPFNLVSGLHDKVGIRNQMKGQLMSGLLKGESIPKIAKRLKDVSEKSLKDSIRIARTETTRVQNSAKMDIGKHGQELGFDMWKRWIATTDGRVREDHLAMNGVEVPQDEPFVLPDGSKMMFPADISMGADVSQVVNCRCTMIEFIKKGSKEADDKTLGLGDEYTGIDKSRNNAVNIGKFEDYLYKTHPEAFGTGVEEKIEEHYNMQFGFRSKAPEDFGYKQVSMQEYVKLSHTKQMNSYPDLESYMSYIKEGMSETKFDTLGMYSEKGSLVNGLKLYENGATKDGYGKGLDARILFDKKYGISKFIDENKDVQYNGGNLFRGVKSSSSGVKSILSAIEKGKTISMNGLSSWSIEEEIAQEFTKYSLVGSKTSTPVIFRDITTGIRPAMPYPYSSAGFMPQYEVIYSGNVEFIPIRAEIKDGIMYVDVKLKK